LSPFYLVFLILQFETELNAEISNRIAVEDTPPPPPHGKKDDESKNSNALPRFSMPLFAAARATWLSNRV